MKRRHFLLSSLLLAGAPQALARPRPVVEVWHSPACGCCGLWMRHLRAAGFATNVHLVESTARVRRDAGIPDALASCHTATVNGYALEGHVPAKEIRRLLAEKPKAVGLAVPGMPMGSPGMEGPTRDPYEVLLVSRDGSTTVYARY